MSAKWVRAAETGKAVLASEAKAYFDSSVGKQMDGVIALSVIVKPGDHECYKRNNNAFDLGMAGQYGVYADELRN